MKKSRKLMSILLIVAMLFTLAAPAMAAPTNATISVAADDNRTYDVYQIFTGDLAKDENKNEILSNVKWGVDAKLPTGAAVGTPVDQTVLDALKAATGSDIEKLAVIDDYVVLHDDPYRRVSNKESVTVPTGYYLFVDRGAVNTGEAYSLYVVQVVGETTIAPKRGTVESEKKVKDTNDSTGVTSDWQDSADYDIGDTVPFQLKGTIPGEAGYANYDTYYYAFHDKQSAGLTFEEDSVKVYVENANSENGENSNQRVEITSGFEVKVEKWTEDGKEGQYILVEFRNLKEVTAVQAGATIYVEYTSILNDKAAIGSAGNPNTMYLEYSNNPNVGGEGDTGRTPDDKVIVFTYKVVVNKTDENEEPLAGAGFTLYKLDSETGKYEAVRDELTGNEMTQFVWEGLDDGDYKLEETTTPAGYNTIAPIEFTITANHEIKSDDPKLTDLNGNNGFTGEVTAGSLSTDVVNNSGATLPETGGMGTTIFYVVGGALVLGAVVLLVTRRRMAE